MTTTIQAQVSQTTLSKVSRLFNASLTDCLNELLQNARRAGASRVTITLSSDRHLVVADDGIGTTNPQTLLTLGRSDWSSEIQRQEDPAGMGIFSLANRSVLICSHNWQVHLTPAHFATDQAAFQARMAMAAERHLRWMVPLNQKMEIRLMSRGVDDPIVSVEMRATD